MSDLYRKNISNLLMVLLRNLQLLFTSALEVTLFFRVIHRDQTNTALDYFF